MSLNTELTVYFSCPHCKQAYEAKQVRADQATGQFNCVKCRGEATASAIDAAVRAQGISQEQWQRWLASVVARKSVILFDTCESGTLTGDAGETKALEQGAANDRLAQATGRSIITAASGSTEAFEGYHGHGLFTYNVLDAIERGDSDNSGTIEVTELAAFVYAQVTSISERVFKQRQEPQMKITANYALTKRVRVLAEENAPVAMDKKPTYQLKQNAQLQIKPSGAASVVRSLAAKTEVTVVRSEGGWSLVASEGKPLGYVADRDLAPVQ
jgi:Caspase domain